MVWLFLIFPSIPSAMLAALPLRALSLLARLLSFSTNATARPVHTYPVSAEYWWVSCRIRYPSNGFWYPMTLATTSCPARRPGAPSAVKSNACTSLRWTGRNSASPALIIPLSLSSARRQSSPIMNASTAAGLGGIGNPVFGGYDSALPKSTLPSCTRISAP